MSSSVRVSQNKSAITTQPMADEAVQEKGWFDLTNVFDTAQIKNGFNFGLGVAMATACIGGTIGAIKAAWIWKTTTVGAQTGMAVAGPVGAVAGGIIGAATGTLV